MLEAVSAGKIINESGFQFTTALILSILGYMPLALPARKDRRIFY